MKKLISISLAALLMATLLGACGKMVKCDSCGKEFPSSQITSKLGANLCDSCLGKE